MNYIFMNTPVGRLLIAAGDTALHCISFASSRHLRDPDWIWSEGLNPILALTRQQLDEYFEGSRQEFAIPLVAHGTAFQQRVWNALLTVSFGATASYRDIAERIDRPSALRAVGAANGRNPIPIVIPCHRVIGSNGTLTGFGGGLEVKAALLTHERRIVASLAA